MHIILKPFHLIPLCVPRYVIQNDVTKITNCHPNYTYTYIKFPLNLLNISTSKYICKIRTKQINIPTYKIKSIPYH